MQLTGSKQLQRLSQPLTDPTPLGLSSGSFYRQESDR